MKGTNNMKFIKLLYLALIIITIFTSQVSANKKDKSLLYQKYPQIKNGTNHCIVSTAKMIINLLQYPYFDMV